MIESTDTNLMLLVKNGDQNAFRELVERHKLAVLNLCLRFTGNKADAEDLAQEVFIRIYQAAPNYEVKAAFTTWLYRITVNLCLNYQRKKKFLHFFSLDHGKNSSLQIQDRIPEFADKGRPDIDIEQKELQQIVHKAIQSLPENQKTVLILYRYHNLSYKEISNVLDTSVSAVESRLHRAKQNLKKKLKFLVEEKY
jgi:RNA polymerase sigma-70 factor (ECF subfamily)